MYQSMHFKRIKATSSDLSSHSWCTRSRITWAMGVARTRLCKLYLTQRRCRYPHRLEPLVVITYGDLLYSLWWKITVLENIYVCCFMAYEYTNGEFSLQLFGQRSRIQIQCHLSPLLFLLLLTWASISCLGLLCLVPTVNCYAINSWEFGTGDEGREN